MSDLYFNEENDLSEENASENEGFCSTILQPFLFEREQKKACGNERHDKEAQRIHASAADLLHIRIEMPTLQKRSERNRLSLL